MMTSLGIAFSDWLNENVSQLVAELVSSVNGSIEKHGHIVRHMCATCVRECACTFSDTSSATAELVASENSSVEQHGEYKFSNTR